MQKYKLITDHIKKLSNIKYGEWISEENVDDTNMPIIPYNKPVYDFLLDLDRYIAQNPNIDYSDYDSVLKRAKIKNEINAFFSTDFSRLSIEAIFAMILGTIRADRFCEGVLLEAFEGGHILRWIKRIKELDELNEIIEKINLTIKRIWKYDISKDYNNGWLLKEDTLKNAFYFHLRRHLGKFFDENNIRVYTEFSDDKFKGTHCRPDMVIAKVNYNEEELDYIAVIEFKYKKGFTASNDIYADFKKLRKYANNFHIGCKLYMATIWEYEDDETSWEPEKNKWAKDKLVELNASYKSSTYKMRFYIKEHKTQKDK